MTIDSTWYYTGYAYMWYDNVRTWAGGSRMGSGRDHNRCDQATQNGYRARDGLNRHSQPC